jgi:carboxyl-terminal processing protease
MVEAVGDPYTYFMTPKQNEEAKADLEGKYEGIGAQLGMRENLILVVAPLKDSPAEAAGVKAGDIIVAVDGKSTKGWTISEAVSKIRGKENTIVKLGLVRNEKDPVNLEIKRQQIKVSSVELSFVKSAACKQECPKVALLKLSQFGDDTDAAWDKAVLEINDKWRKKEITGMVLDLRNNPGGYLEASVYLSSEFLEVGKQIVRQEYADKSGKDYIVERTGKLVGIPLSILINQGSASAAEIMSGALRDHNKAVLVGKKSFGKGSVQEALDLDEGTGLHVTIAKWILPNGDWIHGKGIKPDIDVENKITDGNTLTDETDAQLQRAISEALR